MTIRHDRSYLPADIDWLIENGYAEEDLHMLMYSRLTEHRFVIEFLFRPVMMKSPLCWTGFFNVVVVD